jgi:hypothetical protein
MSSNIGEIRGERALGRLYGCSRLARIVNVSDCTANEYFNFFSLDDTQAPDIVSDSLKVRNINTHLYSFSNLFFSLIMSPMFQALQTLQKRCPLSWLRPVINLGNCTPNCLPRSRAKDLKLTRNN